MPTGYSRLVFRGCVCKHSLEQFLRSWVSPDRMGPQSVHRLFAREFCDSGLFVRFQIPRSSTIIHFRFPEYHPSLSITPQRILLNDRLCCSPTQFLLQKFQILSVVFTDTSEQT